MKSAHNVIDASRLVAALILACAAGSGAQAQSSNAAPAAASAPGLAIAAQASSNALDPFPHGPHPHGVGPKVPPAFALDGSDVDKQNGGDKINPDNFRDDRGPAVDTPYQAPEAATAATLSRTPGAVAAPTFTTTDWPTYGMNRQRTGYNSVETVLTQTNVGTLRKHWDSPLLDGAILTQPVLATGVMIKGVPTDIVYVATEGNTTWALNAATGAVIWQSAPIPQAILTSACQGLFQGKIGVQGTPVIDHANNRIFVVSGRGYLHAYNLQTGVDLPGFNLLLLDPNNATPRTMVYGGLTLSPDGSSIYVGTAGDPCDTEPYHGQVVRASTTNPAAILQRWYPTGASGPDGGGIWGMGGVSIPPDGTVVYALTGNAFANPENAAFAEHVVKLTPTLAVAAANSPLSPPLSDVDFGATALLFQRPTCPTMLAAYNKSGNLFIYNRATIQQQGPIEKLTISQTSADGSNIGLPVFDPVLNRLYVVSPGGSGSNNLYQHGVIALSIDSNCTVNPKPVWTAQVGLNQVAFNPAIPPVAANGVVYYADGLGNDFYALDAADGTILFHDQYTPAQNGEGNFASPMVVNGQVFVAGGDHVVHAYGL
ncbi:PQQ-binding-like beta-propeller repeat protein [Paraburkholderia sp. JPY419]|uniref:outer membrane protein assembly factor BamB family protein n=1 Tax=Paraburkholderia sp. JPY419 TaxID=667660 RepID=UPI003D1DB4EF